MTTRILLIVGALLVFGPLNWKIAANERLRANGQIVYLELAPVDPRSLLQGDYMALNFTLARQIDASSKSRVAILQLDQRRKGVFARFDNGATLNPNEMRFRFRIRSGAQNGGVWLGTNAFFFHEGEAERYRGARFGEFRVDQDGNALLVDLRDAGLRPMPPQPTPNPQPASIK